MKTSSRLFFPVKRAEAAFLYAALIPDTQFYYTCTRATNESFYLDKEGWVVSALDCLISSTENGGDSDAEDLERATQMPE